VLADNGAPWQPSPFWEEVQQRVRVPVQRVRGDGLPSPEQAASWAEWVAALAAHGAHKPLWAGARPQSPDRLAAVERAAHRLRQRHQAGAGPRPGDGDLTAYGDTFAAHFGPAYTWSASRLEAYRDCPFRFFVAHVLGLEPRQEPQEGLDSRQLGNIYHRLLEQVYRQTADPTDPEELLATLEAVGPPLLDDAPRREGFRATAWWPHTRAEIMEKVRESLRALADQAAGFIPRAIEAPFGLRGRGPLVVSGPQGDRFRLRGLIDRVDRDDAGRIRIIDYKTAGPFGYGNTQFNQGKRLQLPLYALAARDALGLGEIADGFYWHVRHAEPSTFRLAAYGVQEALTRAVAYAWDAIERARAGHFTPTPPSDGCPDYCPACAFCWHYRRRPGG